MSELWSAKHIDTPPPKSLQERLRTVAGPREDKVGRLIGEAADEIDQLQQKLFEATCQISRLEDRLDSLRSKN